ncbi:MAG: cell division protein ZipA [Halopseudomonas sp.]|uniref:cell division protein ZipA n=1 Tax=Halopseudomonas sp. TaxID=2901191 RepID=UPI003001C6D0
MDFGLREWLFIIGLLVIAGILFDGWRRMGGRSRIRFKLERNLSDLPEEASGDELLGPPRIVGGRAEREEPSFGAELDDVAESRPDADWHVPQQVGLDLDEPPVLVDPVAQESATRSGKAGKARKEEAPAKAEAKPEQESLPVEEVLVINVVARDELGFVGSALHQSILESGLRFGDMNIFHRHESMSGNGDVLFSMANALKPGVFDLDEMDSGHVRAVSFFMGLPGPRHPKQALDLMIAAARKLSHELGGDLKDEQRSVLTAQTIEHYRQRIAEFERRHYNQRR